MKFLTLSVIAMLATVAAAEEARISRIWLTHRSHDPSKIVVNWETETPGDSVVRYGLTQAYDRVVRIEEKARLHHVEIPLPKKDVVYHYRVETGAQRSADATFKGYPTDTLRVAVVADWQRRPSLRAIQRDDVHLLLTAGDNIWSVSAKGERDCTEPYSQLIAAYPDLFRSTPFMPALGNHDHQIRPRGAKPPAESVYDIEATAFRTFFELPDHEWAWYFDVPDFDVRFIALDLNHINDLGTTWQSCHSFKKGSEQFEWYRKVMAATRRGFVVTIYNEQNCNIRRREGGAWHAMFSQGSIAITGFGYFAERAEVDGFTYYNTSLSGRGDRYPDPESRFLRSEDNYILLTFTRDPKRMVVEIKRLDGSVLDKKTFAPLARAGSAP